MQTLSNPEQRDIYDAMAGFSLSSVNPFTDNSYPADRVRKGHFRVQGTVARVNLQKKGPETGLSIWRTASSYFPHGCLVPVGCRFEGVE